MSLQALLEKSIKIAEVAHEGQFDKGGAPYIKHVKYVMNQLSTIEEKIVGVLHDLVEDTYWTLQNLLNEGFPKYIVDAIDAITKRDNETRSEYLYRVFCNPLARAVKIIDLLHNSDLNRLFEVSKEDKRRAKRYEKDIQILTTGAYYFDQTDKQWKLKAS